MSGGYQPQIARIDKPIDKPSGYFITIIIDRYACHIILLLCQFVTNPYKTHEIYINKITGLRVI